MNVINQQTNETASQGSGSPFSGNGVYLSAGPAMSIVAFMDELLSLYMKLMKENANMAGQEALVQGEMGVVAAQAQRDAAQKQAIETYIQAGSQAFSALITGAQVGVSVKGNVAANEEMAKADAQLVPVDRLQDFIAKPEDARVLIGDQDQTWNDKIDGRIADWQRGDYLGEKNDAYKLETDKEALDRDALRRLQGAKKGELKALKEQLERDYANAVKQRNTAQSKITENNTKYQTFGQLAQTAGNTVAQGFQADMKRRQGEAQSMQTLANTAQSQAGDVQRRTSDLSTQYYNKIAELMQLLQRASNAYPQG